MISTIANVTNFIINNFSFYISKYLQSKKTNFILRDISVKDNYVLINGYYKVYNGDTISVVLGLKYYTNCGIELYSSDGKVVIMKGRTIPLDKIIGVKPTSTWQEQLVLRLMFIFHTFIKSIDYLYKSMVTDNIRRERLKKVDDYNLRTTIYVNSMSRMEDIKELEYRLCTGCYVGVNN